MKKKNILVMSFGSDAGGIERSLIEFLRFLESTGQYEVFLYLWRKPGILFEQIPTSVHLLNERLVPGSISAVRTCSGIFAKMVYVLWYFLFRVCTLLNMKTFAFKKMKGHFDIAVSYCQNGYSPYYVIDKVNADKKIIWYHHGSYERSGALKRMDERYFSKYDCIIPVSNACKTMLAQSFPSLKDKMIVIPNLMDGASIQDKSLSPLNLPKNSATTLVTVGRIAPEKGQLTALNAALILKEQGISFQWYFIGDGEDTEQCKNYIAEHGLEKFCILTGSTDNPYPYIRMANIYVQPSYIEADPLTVKEAKYLKKLMVASNIPAISEVLENGKYGILCEPTADAFAHSIVQLLGDDGVRKKLENAINSFEMNNSIQEKKILNLLS